MRRWAVATLLVASCTLAHAQEGTGQKETAPDQSGNWFTRLFGSSAKTGTDKAAAADKGKAESATVAEPTAVQLAREDKALKRRNLVCLKLREIAIQTHDEALLRQVEELEQRVLDVYLQRTGDLQASDSTLDEQVLEKRLGPNAAASRPAHGHVHGISTSDSSVEEDQR